MFLSLSCRSLPPSFKLSSLNESIIKLENNTEADKVNQSNTKKEVAVLTQKLMSSSFRFKQKLLVHDLLQYIRLKEKVHCLLNGYMCDNRFDAGDDGQFSGRGPQNSFNDNDDDNLELPDPTDVTTPSQHQFIPNRSDGTKEKPCLEGNVGGTNCANAHDNKEEVNEDHNKDKFHNPG